MTPDIRVGDDGELLSKFEGVAVSSTSLTQKIEDNRRLIHKTEATRERNFLNLMKKWERKRPDVGLAKEFFTFGKGKNRVVFCTNPLLGEKMNAYVDLSYLVLTKNGFSMLSFQNLDRSEVLAYALNPFLCSSPSDFHPAAINDDKDRLFVLHSSLRNQQPGQTAKWKTSLLSDVVFLKNKTSKIGSHTTFGEGRFRYEARSVSVEKAWEMSNAIQGRVKLVCDQKAGELERIAQENQEGIQNIVDFFGELRSKKKNS